MIKELVSLADNLDSKGLSKEADRVDAIILKISSPHNKKKFLPEPLPATVPRDFANWLKRNKLDALKDVPPYGPVNSGSMVRIVMSQVWEKIREGRRSPQLQALYGEWLGKTAPAEEESVETLGPNLDDVVSDGVIDADEMGLLSERMKRVEQLKFDW